MTTVHGPCDVCDSTDGYVTHDNGSRHCYVCGHHDNGTHQPFTQRGSNLSDIKAIPQCTSFDWTSRALPSAVLEKYGVGISSDDTRIIFPCLTTDFVPLGYQTRPLTNQGVTRDFRSYGTAALFGMHTHKQGNATLIICEGATDTMSMSVMYPHATCIGVPGTGNINLVKQQLPFMRSFKQIYVAFDGDAAGREAATKLLDMLPRGRTRMMQLEDDYDCNRYLVEGLTDVVKNLMANAYATDNTDCFTLNDYDKSLALKEEVPVSTGIQELDDMMGGGLYPGTLSLLAGDTGCGKSELGYDICVNVAKSGNNVLVLADEMSPMQILRRLSVMWYGGRVPRGKDRDVVTAVLKNIHIYNKQEIELTSVSDVIERYVAEHDVRVVFIDTVSGIEQFDDWKVASTIMKKLNKLTQPNITENRPAIHIMAVAHTKKNDSPDICLDDIRGGASIKQQASFVMGICKVEDLTCTDRTVKLLKLPRNHESTHREPITLAYDLSSRKYSYHTLQPYDEVNEQDKQVRQQARRKLSRSTPAPHTPPAAEVPVLQVDQDQVPAQVTHDTDTPAVVTSRQPVADVQPRLPLPVDGHKLRDEGTAETGRPQQVDGSVAATPVTEVSTSSTAKKRRVPLDPYRQAIADKWKLERQSAVPVGDATVTL